MWKNFEEGGMPQMTIWGKRIVCWMLKAINTHACCEILITFPLQNWLHERASVLRYTYIASPVLYLIADVTH